MTCSNRTNRRTHKCIARGVVSKTTGVEAITISTFEKEAIHLLKNDSSGRMGLVNNGKAHLMTKTQHYTPKLHSGWMKNNLKLKNA